MNTDTDYLRLDVSLSMRWDEPLDTALASLANGWATVAQLQEAVQWCRSRRPKVGELAVRRGCLTVAQVFRVLEHQAESGGLFGSIAVELGFLSESDVIHLLQLQSALAPALAEGLLATGTLTTEQAATLQQQIATQHRSAVVETVE